MEENKIFINILKTIIEIVPSILIAIFLAFAILQFFMPSIVREESMEPNFHDKDYVIASKMAYRKKTPERNDVVIVKEDGRLLIKRVIALPGEIIEIKNEKTYINGTQIDEPYLSETTITETSEGEYSNVTLAEDEYFVMGDHREVSMDSRYLGPINKKDIVGKVIFKIYPFKEFGKI